MKPNPYLAALEFVKQNSGTSGQAGLAKCILSLYNDRHAFSIGEILLPLDRANTEIAMDMVREYAEYGETEELRLAGKYVYENYPRLIELSNAMSDARTGVMQKWNRQIEEEMRCPHPDD